jgi:phage-related minor tail protein
MNEFDEEWAVRITADSEPLQRELAIAAGHGRQFSRALVSAFEGVAVQGKGVTDVLKSLSLSISRMALQAAFRPLDKAIGGLFQGLFSGGPFSGSLPFARGGVLSGGVPVPFAQGGVISTPVTFPLNGGVMGLAGERGPEAIMPLARGADGKLGVQTAGRSSGVSVTFNVTTPDAQSFRRTETQIAAMLARAVGQGQRNL